MHRTYKRLFRQNSMFGPILTVVHGENILLSKHEYKIETKPGETMCYSVANRPVIYYGGIDYNDNEKEK